MNSFKLLLSSLIIILIAIVFGFVRISDASDDEIEEFRRNFKIDLVVPWCAGSDDEIYDSSRRDQGTLKFVFRFCLYIYIYINDSQYLSASLIV
jgi:uncharacterized protein (UPF0333 family)